MKKEMKWVYGETFYECPKAPTKREQKIVGTVCSLVKKKLTMPITCECMPVDTYIKEEYRDLFPELKDKKSDNGWILWGTDITIRFKVQTPWGRLVGIPSITSELFNDATDAEQIIASIILDSIDDAIKEKKGLIKGGRVE